MVAKARNSRADCRARRGATSGAGKGAQARDARPSLYAEVTARIVAELEAGRFPWVQPWSSAAAQPGMPRNAVTGRAYSGINVLILWGEAHAQGYAGQGWLTFKQALAAGGAVRKGQRGTCVCYADRFTPDKERARAEDEGSEPGSIPFLKRFTVFNTDQIDWGDSGLPRFAADAGPLAPREIVPVGEQLIAATGADFRIGGPSAFYSPTHDFVQVPPQQAFRQQIDYYRTATHELGHWTGHRSRLARDQSGAFGSASYAREELVAELCAAFVLATLGIEPSVRHSDYVGSWLAVLRADNRAIFKAASLAARAADYLLGFRPQPVPHAAQAAADGVGLHACPALAA
ncbi:zincin-like metallopeptidase domain-containing protein [Sphingomonas sp. HF-S4]|uniref:Zincin-like metallopeptidase domain-containing protein n=1 Tax=Sphingomonas agrestis TaxID=3080540 RepID=A0ABU3Y3D5_9SPHN|nr:zincin-like metallopeptidase domain-containing protein [Sphingomonas sp. HF-S4]MDV3455863.1 zincin-like metallopeptidase domain-containing protein [Sphingomonas sp. HF-S4]